MNELRLENLSYRYPKGDTALNSLSLCIKAGESVGIFGENGSGKSTLLKAIAGLISVDTGKIFLNGKEITDDIPQKRNVAFLFQQTFLYPHLTVYQNLKMGLNYYGLSESEIDLRIKEMLIALKITKKVNFRPSFLSEGEKQRIAIGKALIREPDLLLLDESFAHLDETNKTKSIELIRNLRAQLGFSVILVDHDAVNLTRLVDRVVRMEKGKIIGESDVLTFAKTL